ncbi:MAG: DUF2130 domain-containing protein [Flavobacteriaceae bacterium]|nr:DUF2130 domain-containing protein [Flavobacteriaceae bacterium]MCY4267286.1 DUF2130 domain-containing protein [Flavobacteriaceae bacterium]
MKSNQITCPHCEETFKLEEAMDLTPLVNERVAIEREKFELEEKEILKVQIQAKLHEETELERENTQKELDRQTEELKSLRGAESKNKELQRKIAEYDSAKELEFQEKFSNELEKKKTEVKNQAKEERQKEVDQLKRTIAEQNARISRMEEHSQKSVNSANQGLTQTQGQIQEDVINNWLRDKFPYDNLEKPGKGSAIGTDILHTIREVGFEKGRIAIEIKDTQKFQKSWIDKLKQDMERVSADLGVLITSKLAQGMADGSYDNGVFICTPIAFRVLSDSLRTFIIKQYDERVASSTTDETKDKFYRHFTSDKFRTRLKEIVHLIEEMGDDYVSERNRQNKLFNKRQKYIMRLGDNFTSMWGDIDGLALMKGEDFEVPPLKLLSNSENDKNSESLLD